MSVPRTASSPSTVASHLAAADRAAHRLDVALERQHVAGPHDALEANVVDAGEERELAAVLLLREHGDGAALRERLDHLHARHDRVAGEVAGAVLLGDRLARDARARPARARAPRRSAASGRGAAGPPRSRPCP